MIRLDLVFVNVFDLAGQKKNVIDLMKEWLSSLMRYKPVPDQLKRVRGLMD